MSKVTQARRIAVGAAAKGRGRAKTKGQSDTPDVFVDKNDRELAPDEIKLLQSFYSFSERIQDLNSGYPITRHLAAMAAFLHSQETDDFANKYGKIEVDGDSRQYLIPLERVGMFEKMQRILFESN